MSAPKYSKKLLDEFDTLTAKASSLSQMARIEARLALPKFIETHGKEVCDEMFEELRHRTKHGVKVKYHVHCHDALMDIKAATLAGKEPQP